MAENIMSFFVKEFFLNRNSINAKPRIINVNTGG